MSSPSETKPCDSKAKEAEYQALWQCCDRTSRKAVYFAATNQERKRAVLNEACQELMDRRREQGKTLCGTKIQTMVDLHLQRELNNRLLAEARLGHIPSPSPNLMAYQGNPSQFMANSVPIHAASSSFTVFPAPQQQQPPQQSPLIFNSSPYDENNALGQEPMPQQASIATLINTLRSYDARISELHARVLQLESKKGVEQEHDRARTMAYGPQLMFYHASEYPANCKRGPEQEHDRARATTYGPLPMLYHGSEYPVEGIEGLNDGGSIAYTQQRPLTPSSQTNGKDRDDNLRSIGI
ncbi:hypothetical protein BKA59DRAFT_533918 [Fusarium tricinctum]|uniref:Uncharacterized protein n=1 Tax=Fusarium tricinctum TaxID=61284 RepID=A0A8K0W757_9HYPO|nr:hypothetical protein BKA59DRAFT_533918 [Fusarium tricinctum]